MARPTAAASPAACALRNDDDLRKCRGQLVGHLAGGVRRPVVDDHQLESPGQLGRVRRARRARWTRSADCSLWTGSRTVSEEVEAGFFKRANGWLDLSAKRRTFEIDRTSRRDLHTCPNVGGRASIAGHERVVRCMATGPVYRPFLKNRPRSGMRPGKREFLVAPRWATIH